MSATESQPRPPWVNHFFAIVPHASDAAIYLRPTEAGWQLPYVRATGLWLAETAAIAALLRSEAGLAFDFTILRYAAIEANEQERWDRILFVVEPSAPLHDAPAGGEWVDRARLESLPFTHPDQRAPLLQLLDEWGQDGTSPVAGPRQIDPRRAPWARKGWFAGAAAWIEATLLELGYSQTGPVEQLRNWSISSLLAAPTTAGRVYFKAAAALPFFVNEPALTETLASYYPAHLPTLLRIDRERRWMLMEDFGAVARDDDGPDYAAIFAAYGKLQRDSAAHLDALAAAGCIDRSLGVLAAQIDPLLADPLTKATLTPDEYAMLVALGPELKARCARLVEYNIPSTLLHGDLHMGNVTHGRGTEGRSTQDHSTQDHGAYIFFDWTDAAIGFPFLDHFLLYFELTDQADMTRWRDAYLEVWREVESPARLLEAWELAKPLCALHHSISYLTILKHIEPETRDELFHGFPDNLHNLLGAFAAKDATPRA